MKYLNEYRDKEVVAKQIREIESIVTKDWTLMEICGGQTHNLMKFGILNLLPDAITMVHGPGCPVCVTPVEIIDEAIDIAGNENIILCSFGDMLRVPGTKGSLLKAKSGGSDIRIVYSPLEAVKLAKSRPEKDVVFLAVGFETTAPANALAVKQAASAGLSNFSILTSHVLVPPAMEAILNDPQQKIQGFLAAGHVCTVTGTGQYTPIADTYRIPIVVMGFEPVDLLSAIKTCILMLEAGEYGVRNEYKRVVNEEGNASARSLLDEVFEIRTQNWRGIGDIPKSGYKLRHEYAGFDASLKYQTSSIHDISDRGCIAGEILKGLKKPLHCPHFATTCTPENPLGAPMVSSEGACAAYYHYADVNLQNG